MRLTACLIARDEENALPRCLASLGGIVDEICLLDTGSRDRTVEIARGHGAVVGFRAWDQDFSAARNACLELATGDWILQIDADEEIDPATVAGLRQDLESGPPCRLVDVVLLDGTDRPGLVRLPRLFSRDGRIRYRRPVHESVLESLDDARLPPPAPCRLRLIDHGYRPEIVENRAKRERNLSILRASRDSGRADAYDLYKLATTLPAWEGGAERSRALASAWQAGGMQPESLRAEWPWWDRLAQAYAMDLVRRGEFSRARDVAASASSGGRQSPLALTALAELHLRAGFSGPAQDIAQQAIGQLGDGATLVALGGKEESELEWIAARAAKASRIEDRFLLHLERAVSLGSLEGRCMRAGWKISQEINEGWKELDILLRSDARSPCVLVAASEAARSQGDRSTSDLLLEQAAAIPSDSGRLAATRLWMRSWLAGREPSYDLPPFDIEAAAIHGFLAMLHDLPWKPDPFLHVGMLRSTLADILEALLGAGREDVVRRFAAGAASRDADLPGVSGLVEGI
ncbi:MAG TPA: glycosyltransferase family 2 protein [Fibrobacteria bacterium]|nr:glycosyltransferase family 2 protein [Fibrobacteria bacterium]